MISRYPLHYIISYVWLLLLWGIYLLYHQVFAVFFVGFLLFQIYIFKRGREIGLKKKKDWAYDRPIPIKSVGYTSHAVTAAVYVPSTGVLTYTPPDLSSYLTGLTSHTHTLIGLTDTSLIGGDAPQDGEVLTYDATNTTWKAIAPGGNIPDL